MTFYEKDEIRAAIFMTKEGGQVSFAPRHKPTPVRYGDTPPDFSAVRTNLDQIKSRLDKLRADLRAARGRKP